MASERKNKKSDILAWMVLCATLSISLGFLHEGPGFAPVNMFPVLLSGPIASAPSFNWKKLLFGFAIGLCTTYLIHVFFGDHRLIGGSSVPSEIFFLSAIAAGIVVRFLPIGVEKLDEAPEQE